MPQWLSHAIKPALCVALALIVGFVVTPTAAPLGPTASLASPIGLVAQANPDVGVVTSDIECADVDHCWQTFDHALVTWSAETGAHAVPAGPVLSMYTVAGGPEGRFGFATQAARQHIGGQSQHFAEGGIFTTSTAALEVVDAVWDVYQQNGTENGPMGYPITNTYDDPSGISLQRFTNGVMQLGETPIPIWGSIAELYTAKWTDEGSRLGLATSAPRTITVGEETGLAQAFTHALVYSTGKFGTHTVSGRMLERYTERGLETSPLGVPRSPAVTVTGGESQDFAGGTAYLSSASGEMFPMMYGDIRDRYNALGGIESPLGFPTSDRTAIDDNFYQRFDNGILFWVPDRGAMMIDTVAFEEWLRRPAALGLPTQDSWTDDRGAHTKFDVREVIASDGNLYSAEGVGPSTAVLICDSQCNVENSWLDQGARIAGYTSVVKRGYGGAGYSVAPPALTTSVANAVLGNEVMLPAGDPGVVILSLGGNDATQGISDAQLKEDARRLMLRVQELYPDTPMVVNGVLSRDDAGHARRRAVDKIIIDVAKSLGIRTVSLSGWGTKEKLEFADNVHVTTKGHGQMGTAYGPALRNALGR